MDSASGTLRAAAWLLFAGGACAIVGAMLPPYRQWTAPLEEGLRAIAGNPVGWWSIHAGFFLGTVLSAVGLALFAAGLRGRPGGDWALVAAVAFAMAGTAWIVNIAYRVSVWNWAAEQFVATGSVPAAFTPLHRLAAVLFSVFSLVGYASVACLGMALLGADLGPAWLRWGTLVCGVTAGFVVGYNVPFIMYIPFVAIGIMLLRSGASGAVR